MKHMEKPTIIQTPHQTEDGALKVLHDYFAHVLLPYWKIPGGIEHPVTEFTSERFHRAFEIVRGTADTIPHYSKSQNYRSCTLYYGNKIFNHRRIR